MRRGLRERTVAWLYTGPLGHLWSAVGDLAVFWTRLGLAKARGRRQPAQ